MEVDKYLEVHSSDDNIQHSSDKNTEVLESANEDNEDEDILDPMAIALANSLASTMAHYPPSSFDDLQLEWFDDPAAN